LIIDAFFVNILIYHNSIFIFLFIHKHSAKEKSVTFRQILSFLQFNMECKKIPFSLDSAKFVKIFYRMVLNITLSKAVFFKKLFPAFRTRYFLYFGCGSEAAAAKIQKMSSDKAPIGARVEVVF